MFSYTQKLDWKEELPRKALTWACQNFPYVAYFCPKDGGHPEGGFEHLLFAGSIRLPIGLEDASPGYYKVGIVGYDQKNKYEQLTSGNISMLDLPEQFFFRPSFCLRYYPENHFAQISSDQPIDPDELERIRISTNDPFAKDITIIPWLKESDYLSNVEKIQGHIQKGDVYELNYCQAFSGSFSSLDTISLYEKLAQKSPMPFSAYFKIGHQVMVSASPERFLKRRGDKLTSQPIKGTKPRSQIPVEDERLVTQLRESEKEKAENLMIVDLMRNDLSKLGTVGSVKVDELFGIYRFKQVSQMISTISCQLQPKTTLGEIFQATFPMGSMTGAPKIRAMELIDEYENFRRGWFSGAFGYVTPTNDFDFSVVIRSIFLDLLQHSMYFAVGSAITSDAIPQEEYQECLLKAKAIQEVLIEAQQFQ
jgi:para-aminobenzoate synthetase component I